MNILEQLNIAKKNPLNTPKVTTHGNLAVGEKFEFASTEALRVGSMVYVCHPRDCAYGRAIITNNPRKALYEAKRTS